MVFEIERIERIVKDLKMAIYPDLEPIPRYKVCEGKFAGGEHKEFKDENWNDYITGSLWGGYDKHQWFRTTVKIPGRFEGKSVVFRITTGREGLWDATNPQFLFYVDGKLIQGLDVNHREVLLSECAETGKEYSIAFLGYSGLIDSKIAIHTAMVVLDRRIEDIYYNLNVPLSVAKLLENNDDNKDRILIKLGKAIDMLDLRKLYSCEFYKSVEAANSYLQREFYSNINYNSPVVTAIGHTHIDIAWLWTISQTKEKAVRSFSTVLNLMKQYTEYKFMSSQPQLYEYIKENEPQLYEEIKKKVKEKAWEIDGAMWLEADCNIPSGESLIRQIILGHKFFKDEFGIESKSLWLPDVFGYSAALPQILLKSGIKYFMTTKLDWNQFNTIPNDTFMWRGIDGSEVFTHLVTTSDYKKQGEAVTFSESKNKTTYTGIINANQTMGTWKRYQNKDISEETLMLFGYGDGGGGPTKEMLENARRLKYGIPGCPRVEIGFETEFFDRLYEKTIAKEEIPTWVGELYLEYHRGTYTSMGKNKRYNRKTEVLYEDAEMLSTLNMMLGEAYPEKELKKGWKKVLINQFHDIIPGSSIKQVYDESHEQYEEAIELGQELIDSSLRKIASKINLNEKSVVVFNTLSYDRDDIVEVIIKEGTKVQGLQDLDGKNVDIQIIDNGKKFVFFAEKVPSKGYKAYSIITETPMVSNQTMSLDREFENKCFKVSFDENYNITSLYDKKNNREIIKSNKKANVLQAFEDRPMNWENWDIDIFYKRKMWEVNDISHVELIEKGPVRYCISIKRKFCDSVIDQYIYFYNNIPRVDFKNSVDWKEKNILLKAAFPVDINSSKATYEIQYGNIERSVHNNTSWDLAQFEVCAHKWADLSEGAYGVSLLNDCKYGYDIKNDTMRLTLIKAGTYPNPDADLGMHEFTYSIYPHKNTWKEASTQEMAYNLNVPMHAVIEDSHEGVLQNNMSLLKVNKNNCIAEVVKKAETGDAVIVRLYEYKNMREKIEVSFCSEIESVYECDLLENPIGVIESDINKISFEIKPYEIKTFLAKFK
ncbi:alpha-mannosidase [Clostridium swellfunianum]|uniref:alpha-mannosidase n=1 Tax=Clostridium swellfunianum TaxID=1367462 RepID=UPI00202FD5A1|nr:alpha-mannosidase [Clostridium swellfunianum]MCM0647715.1 alpha-mannosidase [Clostridium swellfunianum]